MSDGQDALIARASAQLDQANSELDALVRVMRGQLGREQDAVLFGVAVEMYAKRQEHTGVPPEDVLMAAVLRLAKHSQE